MQSILYVKGDATQPQGDDPKIIVHVCNDIGRWGKGFVLALSKRSKLPEESFKEWYAQRAKNDYGLGAVQFVQIAPDTWVANLIGQHKVRTKDSDGPPPVRYEAIEQGLTRVAEKAFELNASVHMPRIGCGLAGGEWSRVETLIQQQLCENNIAVIVYDWA
jgi:O-acetyl-ADP-ribose deacetylase (regulator of RNase III)